jgi:hypothetical protein
MYVTPIFRHVKEKKIEKATTHLNSCFIQSSFFHTTVRKRVVVALFRKNDVERREISGRADSACSVRGFFLSSAA